MRSPAWRTQRSLAIITFDEDAQDGQRPAQRTPTIILGSAGVRQGFVTSKRYTHYSLLRTIEGALGLGTLTANDRYAQPVNGVFARSASLSQPGPDRAGLVGRPAQPTQARESVQRPGAAPLTAAVNQSAERSAVAWVANYASGTVTPVSLHTRKAGQPVRVGAEPRALAVTPDGRTVYVANSGSGTVTPINTVTDRPGGPIRVGTDPWAVAVTPDGRTVYVANSGSGTVTPISTADRPGGTADPGRGRSARHRHHPRRPDGLRAGLGRPLGHARSAPGPTGPAARSGSARSPSPWPSARTGAPPTWPASGRAP